jgi:hypothetical protein
MESFPAALQQSDTLAAVLAGFTEVVAVGLKLMTSVASRLVVVESGVTGGLEMDGEALVQNSAPIVSKPEEVDSGAVDVMVSASLMDGVLELMSEIIECPTPTEAEATDVGVVDSTVGAGVSTSVWLGDRDESSVVAVTITDTVVSTEAVTVTVTVVLTVVLTVSVGGVRSV